MSCNFVKLIYILYMSILKMNKITVFIVWIILLLLVVWWYITVEQNTSWVDYSSLNTGWLIDNGEVLWFPQ